MKHKELWLQITAGRGPVECAWAVMKVLEQIAKKARDENIDLKTLEVEPGPQPGTAISVLVSLTGEMNVEEFAGRWMGTVQWIVRSPFRPEHKRKNWFVGVDSILRADETSFHPADVKVETMRASGPGGQHVNRTESCVRVTHLPTGVQTIASEERSQHRNRKLVFARLRAKLQERDDKSQQHRRQSLWRAHSELERGNPIRTLRDC
jgi:peptide chain release factor